MNFAGNQSIERLIRVLLLSDYNTRIVMFGTISLGIAGGVIGVFLLLRKRSLIADAVGHAALPGVAGAFLVMHALGMDSKSLIFLMLGALISGLIGMLCVTGITKATRLSQDAALGVVLSVFFGFGLTLLGIIQKMRGAQAAGLDSFIFGKTASMVRNDALIIGITAICVVILSIALFKEFRLFTFDSGFAAGDGWPVQKLDLLLMSLSVIVTIIGLQAVGIILVIAILIIPPASARFWTHSLKKMLIISAFIGATGAYIGTGISAAAPRLPAGAVIVSVLGACFSLSLLFGSEQGLVRLLSDSRYLQKKTLKQNMLRALYECSELCHDSTAEQQLRWLEQRRGWNQSTLQKSLRLLRKRGLIYRIPSGPWILSETGKLEAARVTRNHRLWEVYLLEYADVAAAHVDHSADFIEHILGDNLVAELESLLPGYTQQLPESIHSLILGSSSESGEQA